MKNSDPADKAVNMDEMYGEIYIDIQIDAEYTGGTDAVDAAVLEKTTLATLEHENQVGPLSLTVVITGDGVVRRLNRTYRGVDATTDVLAFGNRGEDSFAQLPDYLGDVVISFPQAQSQAGEAGHPVEGELQLLVVHGVLHLLDYDHEDAAGKAAMWAAQAEILVDLGAPVADVTPEREE